MGMQGIKHSSVKTEISTGTETNHSKPQTSQEKLHNKAQQPADNKAVSHLTDKVATNQETPNVLHSQKNQAKQSAKEMLSAEEKAQRNVDKQYNFRNQTEVPGEMTRSAAANAKQTLSAHPDIPALANLGSDKAHEVAVKVRDSQINDAKKEARLEIAKNGGGRVNKEIEAGGRDARVSVSGSFTEKIKRLPHKIITTDSTAVTNSIPNTERHLNQRAHLEVKSELRQMKTDLAESGETKARQKFVASDGRTYLLQVGAEWKQNVKIAINEGDRTQWKTPEKDVAGYARSGQTATTNQTAPTEHFIASVKETAARKATAQIGLEQQKKIENFVSESRQEMVSEGKRVFSDRKIVGNSAYDVSLKVNFDKKAVELSPNKQSDTEKYIAANPQLSVAEIADLQRSAKQMTRQAINATAAQLKSDLAVSGDRKAATKVEIDGEKYKVKVKADWDVTAGHHKIQESDVKRYLRDGLVYNGGEDIKGQFKFGGRAFTGTGEVEYGLTVQKLKSSETSEMDLLKAQRSQFKTQTEFRDAKKSIINSTTTTLNANTLDMRLDLARTNTDKMTRVVTVNGEKYRLTAKADWNVDAKRVKTDQVMTFVKIAAAVVGAATGQLWIPAAVSALDAAKRGDTLGLVTSGLSLAGGVTGGSLSSILNTSSRVIGAGAALTNNNTNSFDKILAGASLVSSGTKFTNPKLSNTISDISKWGGRVNSVATGNWKSLLEDAATDAISNGVKNQKINQFKNSAYLNSLLQSGTKLGGTDIITGNKITPNKKIGGLKDFENVKDVSGFKLNATDGKNLFVPLPNYKSDGKGGIIAIPTDKANMKGSINNLINSGRNRVPNISDSGSQLIAERLQIPDGQVRTLQQLNEYAAQQLGVSLLGGNGEPGPLMLVTGNVEARPNGSYASADAQVALNPNYRSGLAEAQQSVLQSVGVGNVRQLQGLLGLPQDGVFGQETATAVARNMVDLGIRASGQRALTNIRGQQGTANQAELQKYLTDLHSQSQNLPTNLQFYSKPQLETDLDRNWLRSLDQLGVNTNPTLGADQLNSELNSVLIRSERNGTGILTRAGINQRMSALYPVWYKNNREFLTAINPLNAPQDSLTTTAERVLGNNSSTNQAHYDQVDPNAQPPVRIRLDNTFLRNDAQASLSGNISGNELILPQTEEGGAAYGMVGADNDIERRYIYTLPSGASEDFKRGYNQSMLLRAGDFVVEAAGEIAGSGALRGRDTGGSAGSSPRVETPDGSSIVNLPSSNNSIPTLPQTGVRAIIGTSTEINLRIRGGMGSPGPVSESTAGRQEANALYNLVRFGDKPAIFGRTADIDRYMEANPDTSIQLWTNEWTYGVNDVFVQGAMDRSVATGTPIRIATDITNPEYLTRIENGNSVPSISSYEVTMFLRNGFTFVRNAAREIFAVPPGGTATGERITPASRRR